MFDVEFLPCKKYRYSDRMSVVSQQLYFPLFDGTLFFLKSRTDKHNFLSVCLVLCGIVVLFYLIEGIFRTAVAGKLKLEDVNSIGSNNYTVRNAKTIHPCIVLAASFGTAETSLLHGTTAIRGGGGCPKSIKTW